MIPSIWRTMTFFAALITVLPAKAADSWVAMQVRGSVFVLVDNRWTELRKGDGVASDIVVRTLQAGRAELARAGELIQLDPNTAIRPNDSGSGQSVQQYAGVVKMVAPANGRYQLITPAFIATVSGASLVSHVAGREVTLSVRSGRVEVSNGGRTIVVLAGQVFSSSPNTSPIVTGNAFEGTANDRASSQAAGVPLKGSQGTSDGSSDKTDNGIGNGGVAGEGGQNGNAGGNGKGSGNENGNSKK